MLKAAVFSDTHGNTAPMLEAARGAGADVLIHLGDYDRDALMLREAFPEAPILMLRATADAEEINALLDQNAIQIGRAHV